MSFAMTAFVCLILTLANTPQLAFAETNDTKDKAELPPQFGTVIVRPWLEFQKNGHPKGILIDLANALSKESNVPYRNSIQPHKRILRSLFSGKVDFAILIDSPVLLSSSERVAHITELNIAAITLKDLPPISNIEQLEGLRVGIIRGVTYGPEISQASHFTRIDVRGPVEGMDLLRKKSIDVMIGTSYSINRGLKAVPLVKQHISPFYILKKGSAGLYISKRSQHRALIPVYQATLERMRNEGILDEIFDLARFEQ